MRPRMSNKEEKRFGDGFGMKSISTLTPNTNPNLNLCSQVN